jgi:hypothetical protein
MDQMRISTTQVQENVYPSDKTKQSAMELNQIRRRIGLCMRDIILRFEMNLQNLLFSLTVQFVY